MRATESGVAISIIDNNLCTEIAQPVPSISCLSLRVASACHCEGQSPEAISFSVNSLSYVIEIAQSVPREIATSLTLLAMTYGISLLAMTYGISLLAITDTFITLY